MALRIPIFLFYVVRSGALGVSPLLVRTWGAARAPCDAASPIHGVVQRRVQQQLRMRCRNASSYFLRRGKASNAFPDLERDRCGGTRTARIYLNYGFQKP